MTNLDCTKGPQKLPKRFWSKVKKPLLGFFVAIPLLTMVSDGYLSTPPPLPTPVHSGISPLVVIAGKTNLSGVKGHFTKVPTTNDLNFTLLLSPRNTTALANMARLVTSPGSPNYRKYITPAQFAARFGAAPSAIKAAKKWLLENRLHPETVGKNGLFIAARGSTNAVDRAFHTEMAYYGSKGRQTLVNVLPAKIDKNLSEDIIGVTGLDNLNAFNPTDLNFYHRAGKAGKKPTPVISPANIRAHVDANPSAACAQQISAAGAGLTISQLAQAYSFGPVYASGNDGANTTVALIEFAPIRVSDIDYFASCYGLSAPQINQINVSGGPGNSYTASGELEAELDTEVIAGLAPGATIDIYEGSDTHGNVSNATAYAVEQAAVNNPKVKVISTSWGGCEQGIGSGVALAENYLFEQSAIEGQTWVAASGDTGSTDCYGETAKAVARQLAVDDPASQPFVTGVGGTTLTMSSSGDTQTTWNTTLSAQQPGAGGGGVSIFWTMPNYQFNTPGSLNVKGIYATCVTGSPILDLYKEKLTRSGGAKLCREVPDVSANAGTPVATYCSIGSGSALNSFCAGNGWTPIGGTSAAAPIWAAIFALADSSSACQTAGPVGFANPLLYNIASGSGYALAMTNITTGNNDLLGTDLGYYRSGKGYSPATGLGTPLAENSDGQGLIPDLCGASAAAVTARGLPAPEVTRLLPASARSHGGSVIRLEGVNFSASDRVYFGGKPALSYRVVSPQKIIAVAPPAKGRVHVTVRGLSGKSSYARGNVFSFLTPPTVSAVTRVASVKGGFYLVKIRGNYFYGIKDVLFGTLRVRFELHSARILYAFVPVSLGKSYVSIVSEGGRSRHSRHALY